MKIRLLVFLTLLMSLWGKTRADIPGDWKVYPTYHHEIYSVVDTPARTFFLANGQPFKQGQKDFDVRQSFLFAYDKEGDELLAYSRRNYLSENLVNFIAYNAEKKYLLIVYQNSNIDLLDDDGVCHNIPGLKSASLTQSKNVNGATFDNDNNRIYLATDFGYVAVDDKKYEIAESRTYGTPLNSAGRVGDKFIVFDAERGYFASLASPRLSLADYTPIEGLETPKGLMPLSDGKGFYALLGPKPQLNKVIMNASGPMSAELINNGNVLAYQPVKDGYLVQAYSVLLHCKNDGSVTSYSLMKDHNELAGSADMKEFWFCHGKKGLMSAKYNGSQDWTVTREGMLPNTPTVMKSQYMAYDPKYGMLVNNRGVTIIIGTTAGVQPMTMCGLKDGHWTPYGLTYRNEDRLGGMIITEPSGLAIDPDDSRYVYMGSRLNGMLRVNLEDASDLLHMSRTNDPDKDNPGFYPLVPPFDGNSFCQFVTPTFDNAGNLWVGYAEASKLPEEIDGPIWLWPSAKRKAADPAGWISFRPKGMTGFTKNMMILPLRHANNSNYVVMSKGSFDGPLYILDHNGTVEDTSDDSTVTLGSLYDQDGTSLTKHYVYSLYEDPNTGYVWAGTFNGVFYFTPKSSMANPDYVNRVKVSRNDGTNLADYLLDNVAVYKITGDNQGRLWFGTNGGGIFVTSADGKEIIAQFTSENSYLPCDVVLGLCYNPGTNSMMVSTTDGMCEFFMAGSSSGNDLDNVRVYPNPVRPDYMGWVNIDGLVDNALVKIVDAAGNLVVELGRCSNGAAKWDVCNAEGRRVNTGVYFVMMSTSSDDSNLAKVGKILVVN